MEQLEALRARKEEKKSGEVHTVGKFDVVLKTTVLLFACCANSPGRDGRKSRIVGQRVFVIQILGDYLLPGPVIPGGRLHHRVALSAATNVV